MPKNPRATVTLDELITLAREAWRPVLEILAEEGDYSGIDFSKLKAHPHPLPFAKMLSLWGEVSMEPGGIRFLTQAQVVRIHDSMIRSFGGHYGLREPGLLDSTLKRIRSSTVYGRVEFPSIIHRAAFLMHSISLYHPFVDGHKRTAVSAAFVFLGLNGFLFWSRDVVDEIKTAIACASGKIDVPRLAKWMAPRVAPFTSFVFTGPYTGYIRPMNRASHCPACGGFVTWDTYVNRCPRCSNHYRVEFAPFLVASHYTEMDAAEIIAPPHLVVVTPGEDVKRALNLQRQLDSVNVDFLKSIALDEESRRLFLFPRRVMARASQKQKPGS